MDRGAWRATVHGVAKELDTTEQLKDTHTHTPPFIVRYTIGMYLIKKGAKKQQGTHCQFVFNTTSIIRCILISKMVKVKQKDCL